jgi:hypothetical protein
METQISWKIPSDSELKKAIFNHICGESTGDISERRVRSALHLTTPRDKRTLMELFKNKLGRTKPALLLLGRVKTLLQRELRRDTLNGAIRTLSMGDYVYDDLEWELLATSDMCEKISFGNTDYDQTYFDENSWEPLDPKLVELAETDEMNRFSKHHVYGYEDRRLAEQDADGIFVKVKWIRINKGTKLKPNIRCRLVAQELGFGVRDDELFAGTPSLSSLRLLLSLFVHNFQCDDAIMVMDI